MQQRKAIFLKDVSILAIILSFLSKSSYIPLFFRTFAASIG